MANHHLADYELVKDLGRGAYGEAKLYRNKKDRANYVLKKIDTTTNLMTKKSADAELRALQTLNNRHVVKYKDGFEDGNYRFIVMEYCEGGDLSSYIEQHKPDKYLPERLVIEWTIQLCEGLQYIHSQNIIHRDLKPDNIFLTRTKNLKIGDFGLARELLPKELASTYCGTRVYMSPEILRHQPHDSRTDIWSLGCCIGEMMMLQAPINFLPGKNTSFIIDIVPLPRGKRYADDLVNLVELMLTEDKNSRPTIDQLQKTVFITKARQSVRDEPCSIHDVVLLLNVVGNKTKTFVANQNWSVDELHERMSNELGSPVNSFALYSEGETLLNKDRVEDFQLQHNSVVNVVYNVPGGHHI